MGNVRWSSSLFSNLPNAWVLVGEQCGGASIFGKGGYDGSVRSHRPEEPNFCGVGRAEPI